MLELPEIYKKHLEKQFNYPQYLILLILLNLLQNLKTVRLEELARRSPFPIKLKSRIVKLQRFLSLKQFNIKTLWFPIISSWIQEELNCGEVIEIVIDQSQWRSINLLMVSWIYNRRSIPIYFCLLPKKRRRGDGETSTNHRQLLAASGQTRKVSPIHPRARSTRKGTRPKQEIVI